MTNKQIAVAVLIFLFVILGGISLISNALVLAIKIGLVFGIICLVGLLIRKLVKKD